MTIALRALALATAGAALATSAADIVLTPPAGGGVSITNAAGNANRFRVAEDGTVTLPGVTAASQPATGLCVDNATLKVGTCSLGGGGTITGVTASAPLASSGGSAPEISLTGIVPVAKGGTGVAGFGYGVLVGQGGAAISTMVGNEGQMLVGTPGMPAWTYSPAIGGSLVLPAASAPDAGNIMKGANRFIHNYGTGNTFVGLISGNFGLSGQYNSALGEEALRVNGSGNHNVAIGAAALTSNTSGSSNVAIGRYALSTATSGANNIAIGHNAGSQVTTGSFNIAIGAGGTYGDANTVRIGVSSNHHRTFIAGIRDVITGAADAVPVFIDSSGQLGTASASRQQGESNFGGGGAAGVNVKTITFPMPFGAAPKVIVTPKTDDFGGGPVNDTLVASVRSISTTQFTVNVYRIDIAGGAWSANTRLAWMAWQ